MHTDEMLEADDTHADLSGTKVKSDDFLSYQDLVETLQLHMKLSQEAFRSKGLGEAAEGLIVALRERVNKWECIPGELDNICEEILTSGQDSLEILHDFLERAINCKDIIL